MWPEYMNESDQIEDTDRKVVKPNVEKMWQQVPRVRTTQFLFPIASPVEYLNYNRNR